MSKLPLISLPACHAPVDSYERRLNIKLNELLSAMRRELNMATAEDFGLEVARGRIAGHSAVHVFGKNPDVDVGAEDVWGGGATWVPPTQARVHAIVSSDVNDDGNPAGTGAQTVRVTGLDANYAVLTEDVTLNGTGAVNTSGSYIFIGNLRVLTAGASGPNVGTITATAAVDGTVSITIQAMKGESQLCVYQVPAGYTAYVDTVSAATDTAVNSSTDIEFYVKPFGGAFNLKGTLMLYANGTTGRSIEFAVPLEVEEKSIMKLRAVADANNTDVTGWIHMILVQN